MQKPSTKSPSRWQLAIVLMVATFLLGMGTTMFISIERGSGVTDPDYYQHGLNYAKGKNGAYNEGLDWGMSASLAGSDLQVRVHDEKGAPVTGGRLLFQTRHGNEKEVLTLAETSPGVFVAPWPASGRGELRGELLFTRGESVASQKVVFFN
ncbi:FixH family protein [Geomonas agri]|uniref:FixH family protein n=1 Tax=Geomonas agri TaxID=2873702 RepID=UPI001CD37946|nr:FixH family protein [Geomonas agri]